MILIIDCGSVKSPFIQDFVAPFHKSDLIKLEDFHPIMMEKYVGLIVSGAPILVTEIDPTPYLELFSFLKDFGKPVFGICFGHQILGMIHGAKPEKCHPDRTWQTINKIQDHAILHNLKDSFEMMEDHCECISVPKAFDLLASSDTCENEIMIHQSKPMLGVQFHPEVSEENGKILFENFFNNFF